MSKHKILLVDDEPNILKSLTRLLSRHDYEVLVASSGDEGLNLCLQHDIHLILSDYRMPEMNGVEFLSKVRSLYPAITRIVLSGFADATAIVDAINQGQIYKFITKPWEDSDLLQSVKQGLEKHDLLIENENLNRQLSMKNKELQEFNKKLEQLVRERTLELEMNVNALTVVRNIINLLPLGVLGIDNTDTMVYMNKSLKNFLPDNRLCLACNANEFLPDPVKEAVSQSLAQGHQTICRISENVGAICSLLTDNQGIVIVFYDRKLMEAFQLPLGREIAVSGGNDGQ